MCDCDKASSSVELTQKLMNDTVKGFSQYYGIAFMSYNPHVIQHFPDVACRYSGLDGISAYPFENHLGKLKIFVRTSHDPLTSIVKGIRRRKLFSENEKAAPSAPQISVKPPNNIYVDVKWHKFYEAISFHDDSILMKEYLQLEPFFTKPVDSSVIDCYLVKTSSWRFIYINVEEINKFRQGMRVDLSEFPGVSDPTLTSCSLLMGLLHNQL